VLESFLIGLREALQACFVILLVLSHPEISADTSYRRVFLGGLLGGLLSGFIMGYLPSISRILGTNEQWAFMRYITEFMIFYTGLILIFFKASIPRFIPLAGLYILGIFLSLFDARDLGFIFQDIGQMKEKLTAILLSGMTGLLLGLLPLLLLKSLILKRNLLKEFITTPGLLVFVGTLRFLFGGVGELHKEGVLLSLQKGIERFLNPFITHLETALMIPGHPFLDTPFASIGAFLASDRMAMTLLVLFLVIPPLGILLHIYLSPEPEVSSIEKRAAQRLQIASFRRETLFRSLPGFVSFFVLMVLIHAVNISINPLYDPVPIPVRADESGTMIKIPISGKLGDLTDGKLRKFVYYHGNREIIFLAILKPDGSVGVALDQCEICRPAEWNKSAEGYAQRGDHLVCKYCMTPISLQTINSPGGCNPIPLPFKFIEEEIVISVDDLVRVFEKAESMEKKGTHL
jgi:hypothetical protein